MKKRDFVEKYCIIRKQNMRLIEKKYKTDSSKSPATSNDVT